SSTAGDPVQLLPLIFLPEATAAFDDGGVRDPGQQVHGGPYHHGGGTESIASDAQVRILWNSQNQGSFRNTVERMRS
ncbi:MAG: hypothetical protein M0Q01_16550, partial [Syntrophales bacterium]|nr:hypothetical protein [Syntrophales bacterium]